MLRVGVIGGSGLYEMEGLTDLVNERVDTPFGEPSDTVTIGRLGEVELVFLPRHGRGHRLNPSEVPYRANIYAMKKLGVQWIISVSAVGSLREAIVPGHIVVVDQFIDRTKARPSTFFEKGLVAHVGFADPVCGVLREILLRATATVGATTHDGGTYVCMEGPAFSTKAESELYRSWGASVIGMTALPEAKLAREAGISYATLALATDYDCWREGHDAVTVEQVVAVMKANVSMAKAVIGAAVPEIAARSGAHPWSHVLRDAILSDLKAVPAQRLIELEALLGDVLP